MAETEKKYTDLEKRANYMEDSSRRNNLRIDGIPEVQSETWEQTALKVTTLLQDKLEMPNVELERAHRVGMRDAQERRPRTIVARFSRFSDRDKAIRNARKLKGTKIYLNEDLCAASVTERQEQLPALKQARAQGHIAYFNYTTLVIKPKSNQINPQAGSQRPTSSSPAPSSSSRSAGGALAAAATAPPPNSLGGPGEGSRPGSNASQPKKDRRSGRSSGREEHAVTCSRQPGDK